MYGTQVRIFQQLHQVRFCCFLQCHYHSWCHSKLHVESLQNRTDQALKWKLTYHFDIFVSPSMRWSQVDTYVDAAVLMLCQPGFWVAFSQKWTASCPLCLFLQYIWFWPCCLVTSETEMECVAACQSNFMLV